jgi:glycosyltransferase involved in cell wall biosynthesis
VKVWIITVGEPLPVDGKHERLYRSGILCDRMADEGHEVTWWTSSFNHTKRTQRDFDEAEIRLRSNQTIMLVPEPGYSRSVSLRRIASHALCARRFRSMARAAARPDVILVSYPTIELTRAAVGLGKEFGVPVVVDIRDLWPDIFIHVLPQALQAIGRFLLLPYDRLARKALREADAIVAITEGIRDWGLAKAGRAPGPLDRDFPFGYARRELLPSELGAAEAFWKEHGISDRNWNVCFFGAIGKQTRFEAVIAAARLMKDTLPQVRFILCGTGEKLPAYERMARGLPNVSFPGWIDGNQIAALMKMSKMGLTAYPSSDDFLLSIPNKPIEYMSAGLPFLSNIEGTLGALIREHGVGALYRSSEPASLVDAIVRLIEDPDAMLSMEDAAAALFNREFDAATVYANYSRYLQEVAEVL